MKVIVEPTIMARLLSYAVATQMEFSGFGFCERREGGNIHVYDFALLDVGSYGYTEIDPKRLLPLLARPDRTKMKAWIHRHPMGTGIPGPHNWSATDERTIRFEPLGSTPEAVGWSVSLVLTPKGFVGRIDNYVNGITRHLEVEPATTDFFAELMDLEAELWPQTSSGKHGKKSTGSPSSSLKKTRFSKKEKSQKNGKAGRKKSKTQNLSTETSTSLRLSGSLPGSTIQLDGRLPTSATTTDMTGAGPEDS